MAELPPHGAPRPHRSADTHFKTLILRTRLSWRRAWAIMIRRWSPQGMRYFKIRRLLRRGLHRRPLPLLLQRLWQTLILRRTQWSSCAEASSGWVFICAQSVEQLNPPGDTQYGSAGHVLWDYTTTSACNPSPTRNPFC
ncbi:UNVERIFIED_CONTAM: hypothetical protein Slati_3971800 [Sesamum latifolium]|uniref:Uncharacterized protein n=1 Tax=Sesamum latifolium TaxID=2727402 RepID=A0AAW2TQ42_9LAMI